MTDTTAHLQTVNAEATTMTQPLTHPPARRIEIMGVAIDAIGRDEAIARILDGVAQGRGGSVMTPNVDHLRQYNQDSTVRSLFDSASLVLADGTPLVWASRLQGTPLPERVAGSDLILSLTSAAAPRRIRLFLLGGASGTAERAADALARQFPGIDIVGTYYPEHGFERDEATGRDIEKALLAADPQLVYVGLPFPKADRLILRLRGILPQAWFLALGVSFSFVAGDLSRAPAWMHGIGLEWVHRLLSEPRRLHRRYLLDGAPFAIVMLGDAARRRLVGPAQK
jgi:N-acetylglucosaminyldiphosphoundecaprenol N-acetyl-beta-D-mannosaminyltransferase